MQVTVQQARSLIVYFFDESLSVINSWLDLLRRELPPSVEVTPCQRATIISIDDTIWVEHGYDLKYEVLPEYFCLFIVSIGKEVDDATHHPRSNCFSRVHSC